MSAACIGLPLNAGLGALLQGDVGDVVSMMLMSLGLFLPGSLGSFLPGGMGAVLHTGLGLALHAGMGAVLLGGFGFGLLLAAPVGPMSLLCMNRTLHQGFRHGFATGLGIALADGTYAVITVAGFRSISSVALSFAGPLRLLGGLFLLWLGIRSLRTGAAEARQEQPQRGIAFSLISSFLLTLANPATILTFLAFTATLGAQAGGSLLLPVGTLLGSISWWLLLSGSLAVLGRKLPQTIIRKVNVASAAVLALLGLAGSGSALLSLL